jgi:hypothetical protein
MNEPGASRSRLDVEFDQQVGTSIVAGVSVQPKNVLLAKFWS